MERRRNPACDRRAAGGTPAVRQVDRNLFHASGSDGVCSARPLSHFSATSLTPGRTFCGPFQDDDNIEPRTSQIASRRSIYRPSAVGPVRKTPMSKRVSAEVRHERCDVRSGAQTEMEAAGSRKTEDVGRKTEDRRRVPLKPGSDGSARPPRRSAGRDGRCGCRSVFRDRGPSDEGWWRECRGPRSCPRRLSSRCRRWRRG